MERSAAQPASVSLGKGAWDCDLNVAIPPEKEVRTLLKLVDKNIVSLDNICATIAGRSI